MVEGARLESVCTPKGYRGFESHSLRKKPYRSGSYEIYARFYTIDVDRVFFCSINSRYENSLESYSFLALLLYKAVSVHMVLRLTGSENHSNLFCLINNNLKQCNDEIILLHSCSILLNFF